MELFTQIDIPASEFKINHTKKLFFVGSCFADNISSRFMERKFHTLVNPFGTIYNPLSIANMVKNIVDRKIFNEHDVFYGNGKWNSWDAHSSLSVMADSQWNTESRDECIRSLNNSAKTTEKFLKDTDIAFITLGSAFVYFLKETGAVVSNCHRQDANLFERRLISVGEAATALQEIVDGLHKLNPNMHVVFTVSPLRHFSDGAHGNNLSKATLQLAINENSVDYFPSYEIVMDELRDYRFYDKDMIHLSPVAEDYIFERMVKAYCDDTTSANIKRIEKFIKSASHRIENIGSVQTAEFAKQQLAKAEDLERQIPDLDLNIEKEYFRKLV